MRSRDWDKLLAGLLIAPIPLIARAETYLTESQAAAALFPDTPMKPATVDLESDEVKQIERASGQSVLDPHIRVWWGPHKEALVIDRVMGKHDFITYAVGIEPNGKVKGIEILDYRETYGYQIRDKDWRDHFVGKGAKDPLRFDKDIPSISGATLSSKHVTDGVHRVLLTYDLIKDKA